MRAFRGLPVSDSQIATGSIGSIDVAPSNPNHVWVGTGSAAIRSNVIIGRGVYRSTDAGKTWKKTLAPRTTLMLTPGPRSMAYRLTIAHVDPGAAGPALDLRRFRFRSSAFLGAIGSS